MTDIVSFTFFDNCYLLISTLPEKKQQIISLAVLKYMFEGIEPNFNNDRQLYSIWVNLVKVLAKSKKQALNVKKRWEDKKDNTKEYTNDNTKKNTKSDTKRHTNNISYFLFLFSNLYISNLNNKDNIYKLFKEYLELRTKNKYTVTETVVKRLINKLNEYGITDEEKIEIITNAINGAWKDFYPLKKHEEKPNWYGKEQEETSASDDEIKELEERLKRI